MTVDLYMDVFCPLSDFEDCLDEVAAAFEGDREAHLVTHTGRKISFYASDDASEFQDEVRICEGQHAEVCLSGGQYHLSAKLGERYGKISLGWCSPFSVSTEQYDDLLRYTDSSGEFVRTVGLPGEMCAVARQGSDEYILLNRFMPPTQVFDESDVDGEAEAWFAAVSGYRPLS